MSLKLKLRIMCVLPGRGGPLRDDPRFTDLRLRMNLARIMHKFSTASPKSLGLTVLRLRRPPQRTLQYAFGGLGRAWRNALRPALSPLRDENLCIIRAGALTGQSDIHELAPLPFSWPRILSGGKRGTVPLWTVPFSPSIVLKVYPRQTHSTSLEPG